MKVNFRFVQYDMKAQYINVFSSQVHTHCSSPDLSASLMLTINIFIYLNLCLYLSHWFCFSGESYCILVLKVVLEEQNFKDEFLKICSGVSEIVSLISLRFKDVDDFIFSSKESTESP